jgi:hypothetical protein
MVAAMVAMDGGPSSLTSIDGGSESGVGDPSSSDSERVYSVCMHPTKQLIAFGCETSRIKVQSILCNRSTPAAIIGTD